MLWQFLILVIILAVVALVLYGASVVAREFVELHDEFVYMVWGLILLVVGGAVYLAIATPSFAARDTEGSVRVQKSNLLSN